ncbi:MAG: hypothetical protein H6604_02645 [Flavobacteriales bacterium]|nr:hypothetical protein [Flavobacteriales bacterium]
MAFSYGKKDLEIKNPFKEEGLLDLILGLIIIILGILLVFRVRMSIISGSQSLAWLELVLSIIFLIVGIRYAVVGSLRIFRFLVGRDIPSDISPSPYKQETIEKVLMNRSNPTYMEKKDFISRLIISVFDKFLFLPIGFRNLLEAVSSIFFSFLIFLGVYLLAVFSTSIGLITLTNQKTVITLFGVFFVLQQLIIWVIYRPNNKRISTLRPSIYGYKNIVFTLIMAILAPLLLELALRDGNNIPNVDINVLFPIVLLLFFSVSLVLITYYLSSKRLENSNPETEVSEYKEHIQVSVHPKDIFRCFELEMANKRYLEHPNRIYKQIKPVLELEGSENKGSFTGGTIQETQPIYKENSLPNDAVKVRLYISILGRIFMLSSFVYLFFGVGTLVEKSISINSIFNTFYYPILLSVFSYYLIRIAHLFYSEILFSSYLVHFFTEGTYSESKVSSGMSIYDSNRSENTVVNSSATPWILVSKIITSTFADSSSKNLEGRRFILEMYKADEFLDDLVNGFTKYMSDRNLIVGFNTKEDIKNSMNVHKLNNVTRANDMKSRIEESENN